MQDRSAHRAYHTTRIQTAGTENLILMLHQGAVKFLNLAEKSIDAEDYPAAHEYLVRSQDIVQEIRFAFPESPEDEAVQNVRGLYAFMYRRLVEANREKDRERVAEVREMMREMHEGWNEVVRSTGREDADSIDVTG